MIDLIPESSVRSRTRLLLDLLSADILEMVPGAQIEEIGSTSIPGAITKGDLDLLVLVEENRFTQAKDTLTQVYETNEMEPISLFASFKGCREGTDFGIQLSANGPSTSASWSSGTRCEKIRRWWRSTTG